MELSRDVGATLHIEPDDTPKAGEVTQLWFALTRKGGVAIPLADCDCALAVYTTPVAAEPWLEPELTPISAEGYAAIPGAQFTFPAVGAYELVLTGQPQANQNFAPFELRFEVLVAAGSAASEPQLKQQPEPPPAEESDAIAPSPHNSNSPSRTGLIVGGIGGAIAILTVGFVMWQQWGK